MQEFPHHYEVVASATPSGAVTNQSKGIPDLAAAPPSEFGGPGDRWSPETLLMAAVADCFVLSFRAVARASRFDWTDIRCRSVGVLERIDRVTRFTRFDTHVRLVIASDADAERAEKLLQKAEQVCLITQSLNGTTHLHTEVVNG